MKYVKLLSWLLIFAFLLSFVGCKTPESSYEHFSEEDLALFQEAFSGMNDPDERDARARECYEMYLNEVGEAYEPIKFVEITFPYFEDEMIARGITYGIDITTINDEWYFIAGDHIYKEELIE